MKRIVSIVTTVVVSLAAAVAGPGAAWAASPEVKPNRPVYLALGDSLAAGQQSAAPRKTFERTVERWKDRGFVAQFHDTLQDELDCRADLWPNLPAAARVGCPRLQLVNISRTGIPGGPGGVTTATLLEDGDQLDRAVAIIEDRNRNSSPRDDVEVVSLTVGGNDLYGPAVAACVPLTVACAGTLATTFGEFAARYEQILVALRAAGGAELVILTTTYYNPLPFCEVGEGDPVGATALGGFILEGEPLPGLGQLPAGFNDLIRAASVRHGATVADTYGLLGAGDFVGGTDCLHPDADGHEKIADAFARTFTG